MKQVKELRIQVTRKDQFPRLYEFDMFEDKEAELSVSQIQAAAMAAAELGISEIRFTGGNPLERQDIDELIKTVKAVDGIERVSITTSGILLKDKVQELKKAGLDSIDILLDTFFEEKYIFMTGGGSIDEAMDGMEAAVQCGIEPVRVAATIISGLNDDEILTFGQFALNEPIDVIFFEKPNKEGIRLKESENDLKFMPVSDIRKKFKGAVNMPQVDPLVDFCKWFEAKGRIGFSSLEQGKQFGPEITADAKLKASLLDAKPQDISGALLSCDKEKIKEALGNNL